MGRERKALAAHPQAPEGKSAAAHWKAPQGKSGGSAEGSPVKKKKPLNDPKMMDCSRGGARPLGRI
jgi:hypothetical protein